MRVVSDIPWFKVDDKLHSHPKWLALPKGARALWITAGSWSSSQLSDGFVPKSVLVFLDGTTREAAALVDSGLWEPVPGGWQFHDWEQYQPTRQIVTARREASAQRIREWRERKRDETHV